MSANTEKASAGRNLLIYTALVAVVAIYTVLIWKEREDLETPFFPTGLGDGEIYDLEANPLDPEKPMVTVDGVGYFATDKPFDRWDRDVVKVARDDADQYFFYKATTEIGDEAGVEKGSPLLLKVFTDEYIAIAPRAE